MAKLLIIDTFGLIFRAYHAYPMMNTADGKPTNAVYGFIQMLLNSIEKISPDYILCSLESTTPTFRHDLAKDYKANRKEMDIELKVQIGEIINVINTLGIKILQKDGFEADDVIGSFAVQNKNQFEEIKIITGDRDLLQLVSEKIKIMMPGKTFSDFVEFDRKMFEDKYKIKLEDYVLYKSIIGDTSDNIKGLPGVGPKGAEKLVNQFHSIDSILANLDQLPIKLAESITEHQSQWKDCYKLSKIDTDIKTELKPEDIKVSKIQAHKLRSLVERYEFPSLQKRIAKFIDTFEKLHGGFGLFDNLSAEVVQKIEIKYLLTDLVNFSNTGEKDGLIETREAYILQTPGNFRLGNGIDFIEVSDSDLYNFVIKNNLRSFIGFDLKPFIKQLLKSGIEHIEKFKFTDLKLAWHLIKSDLEFETLNNLSEHLKKDSFIDIYELTVKKRDEEKLVNLYKVESHVQKVLAHMEYTGITANREYLQALEIEYQIIIDKAKQDLFAVVGFEFNPASTKDLGHVLFEVLKLPVQKKNKIGYSTDDNTLTKLDGMSDIIPLIKNFRTYSKALSTYVVGLQNYIEEDGRIHTTYNQAQVATGRLSSINPNLQNLPANDSIGKAIKKAFTPGNEERIFISFDYSQIELRVLANETQDSALIEAFKNDEDIHTATAKLVFEKEEISKEERSFAKTINFGIVYGMEPYGLSQALKIDQKSAKAFIDKYFEKFPGVQKYFDRITKQLNDCGYVNTALGRKRYFPSWNQVSGFQKRILFREAINMPIQSRAAEIIKVAMVKVFSYLRENNIDCNLLLQIHDELVFEISKSENIKDVMEKIQEIMVHTDNIGVPIKVSAKSGKDLTFID